MLRRRIARQYTFEEEKLNPYRGADARQAMRDLAARRGFQELALLDPAEDPDTALMLRVKDGDREAFRALFEKYSASVARFAAGFVGATARAEELAQDVFLQVYRTRERYEPRAKFSTWLYTIAHNLCLNEVRRHDYRSRVDAVGPSDDESEAPWDPRDPAPAEGESYAAHRELEGRLAELIAELPEAQRTALILSRVEELRYQQIGEILSVSEQAVKSLIFRATQRLKMGLRGYLEGDR
ncbi:MAG TPA: sigma-70 family RNA polymerase sigma factor [Candidatus Binatia bacterium]